MRKTIKGLSACLFLLAYTAVCTAQNAAMTTKNVILRSESSARSQRVASLPAKTEVTLLGPTATNNYYHVRTTAGQDGWVTAGGLKLSGGKPISKGNGQHAKRLLVRRPASVELEQHRPGAAAAICQSDLASCPITGCAAPDSPHGLANQLKRRVPTATSGTMLTFDDFSSLQDQASSLVGVDQELTADQRATLTGLTVASGTLSEGDAVTLLGFLVGVPHPNTGESVNCNLRGEANNDFHIPMSNDPNNSDFQGIVVEMIPQNRLDAWTLANLTQTESGQRLVMVTGALFYDNLHKVNGDPNNPERGQPHRFSLWEIHPVTAFLVCQKLDNSCDPAQPGDWAPLGSGQ